MRIIKALLVLLFLAPTLAAAEPNPGSSFLRIQREESREPVALQTVIAKYVPASGAKGVEIDLVAVVHIGEKAYYERLNKEFEKYEAVLYELVAPEGIKPAKGGEQKSDNPLAMLQQGIHRWKPWERSTGPKTIEGKGRSARRGFKGAHRPTLRHVARLLRDQRYCTLQFVKKQIS